MTDNGIHPVDSHVGGKIRLRRKFIGISQEDLGKSIDLTFQQVQKYERGSNRVSASKLHDIAKALNVPVQYFFEGYEAVAPADAPRETPPETLLTTAEGAELAEAFPRLRNARHRRLVLDLVRALSESGL